MKEGIKTSLIFVSIVLLLPTISLAISGACSSHGGVNCTAGRQLNGKVICNDGWTDSIAEYDFMVMCQNQQFRCNTAEWESLSKKYGLEELFSKMQKVIDSSPFNQTFYNLLKSQYDQSTTLAERECFAIGADRASQRNFERMQLEFYNSQIQAEQERIKQLEEEEQRIAEWYQAELKRIAELEALAQISCPANSTLVEDKCHCNTGYSAYNNQCISSTDYCRLTYGVNSFAKVMNNTTYCDCNVGYIWNSNKTECVRVEESLPLAIVPDASAIAQQTQPWEAERGSFLTSEPEVVVIEDAPAQKDVPEPVVLDEEDVDDNIENNISEIKSEKTAEEQPRETFIARAVSSIKNFFLRFFGRE